jgi:hypothetical protein
MNALMAANLSHIVQSKDMCGEPARSNSYEETWQHSVVLTGLEPGEHYTYSVGEDPETYWFIAAPPVGSAARTSFVMYGDMGISSYRSAKAPGYASASSALMLHLKTVAANKLLCVKRKCEECDRH